MSDHTGRDLAALSGGRAKIYGRPRERPKRLFADRGYTYCLLRWKHQASHRPPRRPPRLRGAVECAGRSPYCSPPRPPFPMWTARVPGGFSGPGTSGVGWQRPAGARRAGGRSGPPTPSRCPGAGPSVGAWS